MRELKVHESEEINNLFDLITEEVIFLDPTVTPLRTRLRSR